MARVIIKNTVKKGSPKTLKFPPKILTGPTLRVYPSDNNQAELNQENVCRLLENKQEGHKF